MEFIGNYRVRSTNRNSSSEEFIEHDAHVPLFTVEVDIMQLGFPVSRLLPN